MTQQNTSILTYSMKKRQEDTINQERGRLFGFIKSRVSNLEDAEDILQDVLEQFVDSNEIQSIEKASSWLFRVAGNKIIDLYRYRKVRSNQVTLSEQDDDDDTPLMLKDLLPDLGQTPEDKYFQEILSEEIMSAVDQLPDLQRQVFILHELEDYSFKEIEKKLNIPMNTLLSRKRYAVLTLRKKLEEIYKEI